MAGLKPGVRNEGLLVDGPCGSLMPAFGNVDSPCGFTYVCLFAYNPDVPVPGLPNLFLSILSAYSLKFNTLG